MIYKRISKSMFKTLNTSLNTPKEITYLFIIPYFFFVFNVIFI